MYNTTYHFHFDDFPELTYSLNYDELRRVYCCSICGNFIISPDELPVDKDFKERALIKLVNKHLLFECGRDNKEYMEQEEPKVRMIRV